MFVIAVNIFLYNCLMFKDYFYEINEDDINLALPDKPINQYILKHIYHITLDV